MTLRRTFVTGDPDVTVTSQQMEHQLDDCNPLTCVLFSHSPSVHVYYALRSRLETCSEAWLQEFIALDGLNSFLDCLGHLTGPRFSGFSDAILQIDCLSCIRTILNSPVGMETFVNSQDGILKLLRGVNLVNTLPRKQVIEILAALCVYSNKAYRKLLNALDRHKRENHLQHRFSFIINELKMAETVPHKASVLTLINAIICSNSDLGERCCIRNEFIGLSLLDVLFFLQREDPDENLCVQLQVFQEKKHEDESRRDLESNCDLSSPQDLVDAIQAKVFGKLKMVSFVNILQDLLAIEASEKQKSDILWQVLERHVHHIVHGIDDIDAVSELDTEIVCRAVTAACKDDSDRPASETRTSQKHEKPFLVLDQHQCSSRIKKDEVGARVPADSGYIASEEKFSPLSNTSSRDHSPFKRIKRSISACEQEDANCSPPYKAEVTMFNVKERNENRGRQVSMYDNISPVKVPSNLDVHRRDKHPQNAHRKVRVFGPNSRDIYIGDSPRNIPGKKIAVPKLESLPWKFDVHGGRLQNRSPHNVLSQSPSGHHNFINFQRNKLAFPAYVMRNLKWIKFDESILDKYPCSLWVNVDAYQLNTVVDFMHLEEMFREKFVFDETSEIPLLSNKTRLSLNLFLNRLEEDPAELIKKFACFSGPPLPLPLPLIKHLLEILPEQSEVKQLKSFTGNVLNLGQAEQFVLSLSKVPDYQTLLTGYLRHAEFAVTIPHLHSVLASMLEASRMISSNKGLRETLVLILRLGNFLNHGQYNGDAVGFQLSSLARLADLKSREPGHNLVHFIASLIDTCDDKLLDFLSEIPLLEKAASCSLTHIKAEFNKMNTQINSFIMQLPGANPAIKEYFNDFLEEVKKEFRELQHQITELKFQSQQLAGYFCESEPFEIQSCFRQLLSFLKQLRLCRQEAQLMKKQKSLATKHSSVFSEQIKNKNVAIKFGLEAAASSSIVEEKRLMVEYLLSELHRGNFKVAVTHSTKQPDVDSYPVEEKVKTTPVYEHSPACHTATHIKRPDPASHIASCVNGCNHVCHTATHVNEANHASHTATRVNGPNPASNTVTPVYGPNHACHTATRVNEPNPSCLMATPVCGPNPSGPIATRANRPNPFCYAATPDRDLNLVDLSCISLQGTPMMNRPKSELFEDDAPEFKLGAGPKIITSSVRHLPDITGAPKVEQIKEPPVFSLQNSLAGTLSQRSKTHHRSKSDLANSISATTKWIRYHQQVQLGCLQAPLAQPESSMTLATLNLEAGKGCLTNQKQVALVPGPTIELPNIRGRGGMVGIDIFELVGNGKKEERKSSAFSNFFNKISKRMLKQRSSSDQNSGENGCIDIETGPGHVNTKGDKIQHKTDEAVSKNDRCNRFPGMIATGCSDKEKLDNKENICDEKHNPFDRQKKNPIRLSNRFKGKFSK